MTKKIRVKIGKCYISRSLLPGQRDFYATIRSGIHKVKTKVMEGPTPTFDQTYDLEISDPVIKVKVKDMAATCFGGCSPFNTLLAEADVDISDILASNQKA